MGRVEVTGAPSGTLRQALHIVRSTGKVTRRNRMPWMDFGWSLSTWSAPSCFYLIADGRASVFDAFYMTFITVATIGYAETVIPQQGRTPVPTLLQRLVDD